MAKAESQTGSQAQAMGEKAKEAGSQALRKADQAASRPMRMGEEMSSKTYVAAVAGSILVSLGLFLSGRTAAGIFVGLWAPTILNLGLFNKLLQPSQESMRGGFGTSSGAAGGMPGAAAGVGGEGGRGL